MEINQIQKFDQVQLTQILKEQKVKSQIQNNIFSDNDDEEIIRKLNYILQDFDFCNKIYLIYESLQKHLVVLEQSESQICQNYDKNPQEKIIKLSLNYLQNQTYVVTSQNFLQIILLNFVKMTRKYILLYEFLQQIILDSFKFLENIQLDILGIETLSNNCQAFISIFENQILFDKYKNNIKSFTQDFRKYRFLLKINKKFKDFTSIQLKKYIRQIFCSKIILKIKIDNDSYKIQEFLKDKQIFIDSGDEYLIKIMKLYNKFQKNNSYILWKMLINIYESQDICDLIITDVDFLEFFIDLIQNINQKDINKKDFIIFNEVQKNLQHDQQGFNQEVIQRLFQKFKNKQN